MPISLKNTASILPYVRYSPQANSMSIAGEDNKPREIPFLNKLFAMDPENGTLGWLLHRRRNPRLEAFSDRRQCAILARSELQARLFALGLRA